MSGERFPAMPAEVRGTLKKESIFLDNYKRFGGCLSIGAAIEMMRCDCSVRRTGWNGKGMRLRMQIPDANSKMTLPYIYIEYPKGHPTYPDGCRVPWLASQADLLANDWEVIW